jgi:hypothetical protein
MTFVSALSIPQKAFKTSGNGNTPLTLTAHFRQLNSRQKIHQNKNRNCFHSNAPYKLVTSSVDLDASVPGIAKVTTICFLQVGAATPVLTHPCSVLELIILLSPTTKKKQNSKSIKSGNLKTLQFEKFLSRHCPILQSSYPGKSSCERCVRGEVL